MNSKILEFTEEFYFHYPLFLTCTIKPACRLIKGYYPNSGVFKIYLFLSYRVIISSTNIPLSRSWLRSSWNFTFPSIKDVVKLWTRRVWSLYNWCQSRTAQVWVQHTRFQQLGWFFYTLALCVRQVNTALRLSSDEMRLWGHVCLGFYKTCIRPLSCPLCLSFFYCSSESGLCVFEF